MNRPLAEFAFSGKIEIFCGDLFANFKSICGQMVEKLAKKTTQKGIFNTLMEFRKMSNKKAAQIVAILEQYFPQAEVPLTHYDPYTLLIAVLLSAQCTDLRVNQVTKQLFAKAQTPAQMLELPLTELEKIITPCGLYRVKAKAIHELSRLLIEKYHGQVPETLAELKSLPGVGHKTASVVLVQAFGQDAFPVDTHIHRCAKRWGLSSGKNVETTEQDLKKIFPKKIWGKLHLQVILFARAFCPARAHVEKDCPICSIIKNHKE